MILPATRRLLQVFSCLTLLAFLTLFVMSARTDRYFAWTIAPPITAAFLGAAYAAGCVIVVLALRIGDWTRVRVPYITILVFTLITLVATLLHRDRFHFGSDLALARFAAWFWMVIYVVVPVGMLLMLLLQERRRNDQTWPRLPLPRLLSAVLILQGGVLLIVGTSLFVAPSTAAMVWPWPLTPLTARVVAAWLVAFGLAAVLAYRDADLRRLDLAAWAYAALGALELVVVLRYAGVVRWSSVAAWVYLLIAASILASSGYVLLGTGRDPKPVAPPAPLDRRSP